MFWIKLINSSLSIFWSLGHHLLKDYSSKRKKLKRKKPKVCNNGMLQNNLPKKSCFQVYDDYDRWNSFQNHKNKMKSLYIVHMNQHVKFNFLFMKWIVGVKKGRKCPTILRLNKEKHVYQFKKDGCWKLEKTFPWILRF